MATDNWGPGIGRVLKEQFDMGKKQKLTGLKAYEIRRLLEEARSEGYAFGKTVVRDAFNEAPLMVRLVRAFRGNL